MAQTLPGLEQVEEVSLQQRRFTEHLEYNKRRVVLLVPIIVGPRGRRHGGRLRRRLMALR